MPETILASDGKPILSIIVACAHTIEGLKRNLNAIEAQRKGLEIQVISSVCCSDDVLSDLSAQYANVQFLHFAEKTILPTLLGNGIAHSKAEIIAITDAESLVHDHWIQEILKAHESAHLVIGGAVEADHEKKWMDWMPYFCDYGAFMLPLNKGIAHELPGNNISFKRKALKIGPEFVKKGFWKSYWCRNLQKEGFRLYSNPHIIIYDKKSYPFMAFIVRQFHHGSCFAGMRVKQLSKRVRLSYIAACPLLPFVFLMRMIKMILSKKRHVSDFILCFPLLIFAKLSWSCGELWGYLTGSEQSCARL